MVMEHVCSFSTTLLINIKQILKRKLLAKQWNTCTTTFSQCIVVCPLMNSIFKYLFNSNMKLSKLFSSLNTLISTWNAEIRSREASWCNFMDFSKTFETASLSTLLDKMSSTQQINTSHDGWAAGSWAGHRGLHCMGWHQTGDGSLLGLLMAPLQGHFSSASS